MSIPVIGSLNGVSTGGWIDFAKKIEQAGADALELNVYYVPTDPALTGAQVERMYVDLVRDVKASVAIPVAVKVGHAFTALANVARHLDVVGADGLVLFNRFYLPDFDLERLDVPALVIASRDEADPGHPRAVGEEWAQRIPGARFLIEDEGESPLAWQGARLSKAIAAFCREPAVAARLESERGA